MRDDDQFCDWLRSAVPPVDDTGPARDVWPRVTSRFDARREWTWLDMGLAAAIATVLLLFPRSVFFLAYHL